jgi:predicted HAD superfamily Cof-like phosphohydrolase
MDDTLELLSQFHSQVHATNNIVGSTSLYTKLLLEEFNELRASIDEAVASGDLIASNADILEEAADLVIVLYGLLASKDISLKSLQLAIHRKAAANMSKLTAPEFDGKGKILKGKHYTKPSFVDLVVKSNY